MKIVYLASSLCLITSIAGNAWGQELIVNGGFDYGFLDGALATLIQREDGEVQGAIQTERSS